MAKTVRTRTRRRPQAVTQHNRQVAVVTAALLVVVSLYSAALGPNAWLWFGWTVLLLACVALFAVRG
ncbi:MULTISPECIES: hypothetical protein [unclassified Kitasatospora]|uniref:hypothetical protein n=1 Tax=unclassified Kitasatospora TaxID=2633591 RepID=UPI002E2EEF9A|nr:hypothetical protein [Kitasatospora sp. NBC_01246]